METKNKQILVGIAGATLLALVFGYYFFISSKSRDTVLPDPLFDAAANSETDTDVDTDTDVTEVSLPDVSFHEGSVDVDEGPINDTSVQAPNVDRPLIFGESMPEEARAIYLANIKTLTGAIKETGGTISEWLNLGILWKQIGDYEGARLAWEYVAVLRPKASVAFFNLGDLYHYYLKDFVKAESNFKKGITNDPKNVSGYLGLHELYKYSYRQNTAAAASILLDGLRETDDNINLLVSLALYYAEKDDTKNARTYYERALAKAEELDDSARAALIQGELDRL